MKAIKYTILSIVAALASSACSTEEVDRFDPSFEALNIGFGTANTLTQNATFNYSETTTERSVTFYARVTGMPADHDRTFTLQAADGDIDKAAGSYRFGTYVIPAGRVSGEYEIYFDPAGLPDPDAFTTEEGEIVFMVAPGNDFKEGALNQNRLRITLRNALSMPDEWVTASSGNFAIYRYFGTYSLEKFQFMIENGCPVNFVISQSATVNVTVEGTRYILSSGYAAYLRQVYQLALEEYNNTHDTPLSDKHGNPITF